MPSSMTGSTGMNPTGQKLKGYDVTQLPNWSPQQAQLFSQLMPLFEQGGFLQQLAGGDEAMFQQMEKPALRQFAGFQGNLASKFSGAGTGGRHSSGFQNTMNQASANFASDLQSRRLELQQQAIKDLVGLGGQLLQLHPYENVITEQPQKRSSFLEMIAPSLGTAAGSFFGPLGSAVGGAVGKGISKYL